jgi:type IV pilus assembly protein PilN
MMDLETVLPSGVQVTSIEPQISADGDVVIRLRVSGERDRAVQLVRNLERSRRFLQPRLMGESVEANTANGTNAANGQANAAGRGAAAPNAAPGGVEFEILADYNPLPAGQPYGRPARAERVAAEASRVRTGAAAGDGEVLRPHRQAHPRALGSGAPTAAQGGVQ